MCTLIARYVCTLYSHSVCALYVRLLYLYTVRLFCVESRGRNIVNTYLDKVLRTLFCLQRNVQCHIAQLGPKWVFGDELQNPRVHGDLGVNGICWESMAFLSVSRVSGVNWNLNHVSFRVRIYQEQDSHCLKFEINLWNNDNTSLRS